LGGQTKRQKEMTPIIVCDTGPLLHLSEAGAIHLLSVAGQVLIPPLVVIEFEANAQGWPPPQWVKKVSLRKITIQKITRWIKAKQIDAGEAEAIGLALQERADWFLTDDAKARQFAESLGLEVHGSIAILLWSVATGQIQDKVTATRLLDNLANSSLWISDRVLQEAHIAIDDLLT
jgi:predicted nucleic acid-binding protein